MIGTTTRVFGGTGLPRAACRRCRASSITMGHPERMGLQHGWSEAKFIERSGTTTPKGQAYRNLCIGCDRFHEEVLGPVIEDARLGPALDDAPTYLGLPGAKPLLGWDEARAHATVAVVEGVFDFLTLRMWGYPALALLGTHVREDLLAELRSFARIYLVLDNDEAGLKATSWLQEQIGSSAVGVPLPEGVNDPAQLAVQRDGQSLFAGALLQAAGASPQFTAPPFP